MKKTLAIVCLLFANSVFSQDARVGPYAITGKVVDPDGAPVAGALVNATRMGFRFVGTGAKATTGNDGTFSFPVPRPDTYTLTFGKAGSLLISTYYTFYYMAKTTRPEVKVDESDPKPNVVLRMPATFGSIKLSIRDAETDRPLRPVTDRSLGKPLPYQLANLPQAPLQAINL